MADSVVQSRPIVGAIRWDAWSGGEITVQVERTLSPAKYHHRLPWFAEVIGEDQVRISGGDQATMDREIDFASAAGLDYWAFLLYPQSQSMSAALERYLSSPKRDRINFSLILHNAFGVSAEQWPAERDRAIALLKEPGYQKVLGGRPLVFAFEMRYQGAFPAERVKEFLGVAHDGGIDPYMVYMGWEPAGDLDRFSAYGFEAASAYAHGGDESEFRALVRSLETGPWKKALDTGTPYVPLVTTGWDKWPRKEHPVSWELDHGYHQQSVFPSLAAPEEIAAHLSDAIDFVNEHPDICRARAIIIYAWNEFDEGGWLAPTWTPNGPDSRRLDVIAGVLRCLRSGKTGDMMS